MRFFFKIFYSLIILIDNLSYKIIKRNFLLDFVESIRNNSISYLNINGSNYKFYTPNIITKFRIRTFYEKEPETLNWISNFDKKEPFTFMDIGSNVGIYSIYNCIINKNSNVLSIEPSMQNLSILSRNISLNNFQEKINILPIGLTNKKKGFFLMQETSLYEGGALNSFGEKFDFEGNDITNKIMNSYSTFGMSLDELINEFNINIPKYIKIDVDGIEHLILDGARDLLSNNKLKSVLVEINENFIDQTQKVNEIMKNTGFKLREKKQGEQSVKGTVFEKSYNCIFDRD